MKVRVGFGFDVHKLVEGRDLWLGGIKIPHS
ncbi:2-C-methyl-D-erythritol 2,4-cyclodiphosphate synthase, partial [uncultured Prevotella sp.]